MADDTQAQQQAGADQPEPMPSSNQQASTDSGVTEAAQLFEDTQTPSEAPSEPKTEGSDVSTKTEQKPSKDLPDGVSERTTQQFEKLKDELREERTLRRQAEEMATTNLQPPVQEPEVQPIYDPTTGYVDINELERIRSSSTDAQKRAEAAERKFEEYVQQQQETEAFEAHPTLDPDSPDHDPELHKLTRAVLTDSMLNPKDYGGKEFTAKQAADFAKANQMKAAEVAKEQGAQEAVEQLTPKEQASLEATGRSDKRQDAADTQVLASRTRHGDTDAIMERLKGIPPVARS